MTYNLTQLESSTSIYDIVVYANDSTSGLLVLLLILAIFFVILMALKRYTFSRALVVASFVSFILSSPLTYIKLLNFMVPLIFLTMTGFMLLYIHMAE